MEPIRQDPHKQAANAGREVILVNPAYTSQDCSSAAVACASLLR
ncbi:MAG: transposase [Acidobacteria bacterium]|nr:transposase [Acidobacteriota bacterium]